MALQHLALLGKDEASSFLGAYKPNGSRKNLKPWTGPFSELETAQRKNQEGRGLYLGINNGTGLKDADIHECVAFWSEDDKRSKDEQWSVGLLACQCRRTSSKPARACTFIWF